MQVDLFETPPERKLSKPAKRRLWNAWRGEVDAWARHILSFDLLVEYAGVEDNEALAIAIDGSGPPPDWRKRIVTRLERDSGADLSDVNDPGLVRIAVRAGRLPKTIMSTRPPKPAALRAA